MSGDTILPTRPRPLSSWEERANVSSDIQTEPNTLSPGLLLAAVRSLQERRILGARFAEILAALIPSCPRMSHSALRLQLMRMLRRAVNQQVLNRSVGGTYTIVRPTHISGNWPVHIRTPPYARPEKDPHARFHREESDRHRGTRIDQRSTRSSRPSKSRKYRLKRLTPRQPKKRRR